MQHAKRIKRPLALTATLALAACGAPGQGSGGDETDAGGESTSGGDTGSSGDTDSASGTGGEAAGCDFETAVQPIFSMSCAFAGCHGGADPQQGMSLEAGAAHAALVGVDSQELPGTPRVTPGDLDASYLWEKLGASPSVGAQMPPGGQLSASELEVIERWILAGAPADEPFQECDEGAGVAEVEIVGDGLFVQVGELASFEAVALDDEGQPLDVSIAWVSASGERLFVDRDGVGLGVSPGAVELVAVAGGVESAPVVVDVIDHDPPAAAFLADALPVFTGSCALAGCHVDGVETGDLRFDRDPDQVWEKLVGEPAEQVPGTPRITPNDPLNSYVLLKIVQGSPAVGGQMPLGDAPLDAEKAQLILRWILSGASYG